MNPMAPPTILVLTSTSEGTHSTNTSCQQPPRHLGLSLPLEKPDQLPFLGAAYSLLYHPVERRSYPSQLLPLSPPFSHASLEQTGVGLLSYGALPAFPPFPLPENIDGFPGGFLSVKEAKDHSGPEVPQGHYLLRDNDTEGHMGQELRSIQPLSMSPSPHHGTFTPGDKKVEAASSLLCPVCQQELLCAELGTHLQYEIERLTRQLLDREITRTAEEAQRIAECPAAAALDTHEFSKISPLQTSENGHQGEERQQTFLQVKTNRESRMGARAGQFKRIRLGMKEQVEELIYRDCKMGPPEGETYEGHQWGEKEPQISPQTGCMESKGYRLLVPRKSPARENNLGMNSESDEMSTFPNQISKGENNSTGLSVVMLKAQIQALRTQLLHRDSSKCHICLESYSVPLTSIQCWHIHCEKCWLRTLGTKKLCPQCNAITSPADLRHVYL